MSRGREEDPIPRARSTTGFFASCVSGQLGRAVDHRRPSAAASRRCEGRARRTRLGGLRLLSRLRLAAAIGVLAGICAGAGPSIGAEPSPAPAPTARPALDLASLAAQSEPVARALRASVKIERDPDGGRASVSSGVILRLRDGVATIVTAQHVVDPRYTGAARDPSDLARLPAITVASIGGVRVRAKVEWLAPHGIDLAIVSARLPDREARDVAWERAATPKVGDPVFTIGNPQGSAWTRADGTVEQLRDVVQRDVAFTMLWSDVGVQPGFSGGGLYDAQGRLAAINSTRGVFAQGQQSGGALLLSTMLPTLLDLAPAELRD